MSFKALFVIILTIFATQANARPMITDLSERKIDINANFTGKEILLYGARVEAGQIVVVIRGPAGNFMVRKKERIAGMWVNTGSVKFYNIPQFYRIASSKELAKLDANALLKTLQIGADDAHISYKSKLSKAEVSSYKTALFKKLKDDELLDFDVFNLPFLEGTLFRIRVNFPKKIPAGIYSAEIYSFNDGQLMGMQSIPVKIEKVGMEAAVYNFAHNSPAWYGFFAVFGAVSMGLLAANLFKRV